MALTVSGKLCQAWSSQYPHTHTATDDDAFADGSVSAASNYCRNPEDGVNGYYVSLWCYTTHSGTRWETCSVPLCDGPSFRCFTVETRLSWTTHFPQLGADSSESA